MRDKTTLSFLAISLLLNVILAMAVFWQRDRLRTANDTILMLQASPAAVVAESVMPLEAAATFTPVPPKPTDAPTAIPTVPEPVIVVATPTATMEPTPSPEPTQIPEPTPTPSPEPSPTPEPTPEPAPIVIGPDWLFYLNGLRALSGLPPVSENPAWNDDAWNHSRYMVKTGIISHGEEPTSPFFSQGGHDASENGNLATTIASERGYQWAFNYWLSAPFHAVPMLDPQLNQVGFGIFLEAGAPIEVGATLDIKRGLVSGLETAVTYPIIYPQDGERTWVLSYSLPEFPNARNSCPGMGSRTGAPIIIQAGPGDGTPQVGQVSLTLNGQAQPVCVISETSYNGATPTETRIGRNILDQRDAVIILPYNPLARDSTYTVNLNLNGELLAWSFETVGSPPK